MAIAADDDFPFAIVRNDDDVVLWRIATRQDAEAHLAMLRQGFARIEVVTDADVDDEQPDGPYWVPAGADY